MLEVLNFVLGGFWTFVGTCLLISAVGQAIANIVSAARGGQVASIITIKKT